MHNINALFITVSFASKSVSILFVDWEKSGTTMVETLNSLSSKSVHSVRMLADAGKFNSR